MGGSPSDRCPRRPAVPGGNWTNGLWAETDVGELKDFARKRDIVLGPHLLADLDRLREDRRPLVHVEARCRELGPIGTHPEPSVDLPVAEEAQRGEVLRNLERPSDGDDDGGAECDSLRCTRDTGERAERVEEGPVRPLHPVRSPQKMVSHPDRPESEPLESLRPVDQATPIAVLAVVRKQHAEVHPANPPYLNDVS